MNLSRFDNSNLAPFLMAVVLAATTAAILVYLTPFKY
jgi:hypothetical protein